MSKFAKKVKKIARKSEKMLIIYNYKLCILILYIILIYYI